MIPLHPRDVLDFWFGDLDPESEVAPAEAFKRWFQKDPEFDREIIARFSEHIPFAAAGGYDDWREEASSRMALIILLDQFTRNAFRGSPLSWASDAKARELVREGIALGHDKAVHPVQRTFFYLPYEHSEDAGLQAECVRLMQALMDERSTPEIKERYAGFVEYAVKHQVIIDRFGRFPHRNEYLNRTSTEEELGFLKQPGSSF